MSLTGIPRLKRNRAARRSLYQNAFFWGLGNGLFSTAMVVYLIRDICRGEPREAVAVTIAWILAAPRIAGVLRLFVPTLIDRWGNRKRFCITHYALAPLILAGIPLLLPVFVQHSHATGRVVPVLAMLVLFWCSYHLVEYFGTVALCSWYGDLVPSRIRGRFLGVRDAWMIAGQTIAFLIAGLYTYFIVEALPKGSPLRWEAYLKPTFCGVVFCLLSVLPLLQIPEIAWKKRSESFAIVLKNLFAPFQNRRFAGFVFFGCWLQFCIGLTQSVQYRYEIFFLAVPMLGNLSRQTLTRIGQWAIGPTAGKISDRLGTLPVMSVCLVIVAGGSLFYYFARPETWFLIFGAAIVWVFWVGVNIGIWKTVLDFASPGENASYLAVYMTLSTLTLALSTLLGGHVIPSGIPRDAEQASFLLSFVLRLCAVPILLTVFWGFKVDDVRADEKTPD